MTSTLLLMLYGLAFIAAVFTSRGSAGRFAFLLIIYSFVVSIIYWTVLAGVLTIG